MTAGSTYAAAKPTQDTHPRLQLPPALGFFFPLQRFLARPRHRSPAAADQKPGRTPACHLPSSLPHPVFDLCADETGCTFMCQARRRSHHSPHPIPTLTLLLRLSPHFGQLCHKVISHDQWLSLEHQLPQNLDEDGMGV